VQLAKAFIDIGTRNRGNVDAYYRELNDWVRTWDGNSGQQVVEGNRDDGNERKAEGNRDITLSPTFEDDLTYPNLPDSSPARSEASGLTFGRLVTPERTESWLGSNSRAQSLPIAGGVFPSPQGGRSQSHPVAVGQLPGPFTGGQRRAPIGPPPVGGAAGLSPLKEVEEPSDGDQERQTKTKAELVPDAEKEEREDKGSGSGSEGDDDESNGEEEVDQGVSGDEDGTEDGEDELEDDEAPRPSPGRHSHHSGPGADEEEPVAEPETATKEETSRRSRKRKVDEVESARDKVEGPERVVLTRSGRKIRLIKSSEYIQESDDEDRQPPPRSSRLRQVSAARPNQGSSRNHKGNKDLNLKRLASTPCGRCARGNRPCMIFVNKPTVRACATCNASHGACDFVGSHRRPRRTRRSKLVSPSRSRSRPSSSSRSRSRETGKSKTHAPDEEDIWMEIEEPEIGRKSAGKLDPYSAEELAKRRKGKSRDTGKDSKAQRQMKRSPSLPTRPPSKRVKIEGTSLILFTHSIIVFNVIPRPPGHVS